MALDTRAARGWGAAPLPTADSLRGARERRGGLWRNPPGAEATALCGCREKHGPGPKRCPGPGDILAASGVEVGGRGGRYDPRAVTDLLLIS